jgi:hypothetical protein
MASFPAKKDLACCLTQRGVRRNPAISLDDTDDVEPAMCLASLETNVIGPID